MKNKIILGIAVLLFFGAVSAAVFEFGFSDGVIHLVNNWSQTVQGKANPEKCYWVGGSTGAITDALATEDFNASGVMSFVINEETCEWYSVIKESQPMLGDSKISVNALNGLDVSSDKYAFFCVVPEQNAKNCVLDYNIALVS